jgi:hypothetical protein
MEGDYGTPVQDEVWLHPVDETSEMEIQSTRPLLEAVENIETEELAVTIEPLHTEPPHISRQLEASTAPLGNPDGLPSMELIQPTKKKRLNKQRRWPHWFISLEGACFECRRYVPEQALSMHYKHIPEHGTYEDAPLFREEDIDEWVKLFHKIVNHIMDYFNLNNVQDMIKFLKSRKIAEGEERSPSWSTAQKVCINKYFDVYGGTILPRWVTLNPPNSTLVLAKPSVICKLLEFSKPLKRFLNNKMME